MPGGYIFSTMFTLEFNAREPAAAKAAQHAVIAYLEREVESGTDFGPARTIFAELVSNVAEHAPDRAVVQVSWRPDGTPVLTVSDHGPGIDPTSWAPGGAMAEDGRGLQIASALASELKIQPAQEGGGTRVQAVLDMRRRIEGDSNPDATRFA